jgi:hypothetical protein
MKLYDWEFRFEEMIKIMFKITYLTKGLNNEG